MPGSVLRVQVDTTRPVSFGLARDVDVFYDNSPAFRLGAERRGEGRAAAGVVRRTRRRCAAAGRGARTISTARWRRWRRRLGRGTLYLFAPEITFRGQPHGTFKWLFNGIYSAKAPGVVP